MKKLYTLLALVLTLITFAQAPQGFNYQATVRNSTGALIVNQNVNFKFNIMLNSATSLPVFSETHLAPTDDLGQVNLVIGQGTATTGSFSTINWGTGNYYLGIELNTGSGYVAMGTTQLLSVPYALYANTAGNSQATTPNLASVLAVNNSANNTKITNLANPTNAQDAVTKSYSDQQLNNIWPDINGMISNLQNQINNLQVALSNTVQSIQIGSQIWSSKNLDVTTYRDGTPIPQVTDPTQWANLTTGAWCYYNNDSANGTVYGKLYNWYAVAGIHDNDPNTSNKILAPLGWHIPSNTEWTTLSTYLGGDSVAGGKMKETSSSQTDTYSWYYDSGATNLSGFSAKPASWRYTESSGTYFGGNYPIKMSALWWSSSEFGSGMASLRNIQASSNSLNIQVFSHVKSNGLSVRCIKD
ncbi:FISUMP domain-containing protein [Flavobacterium sp.]|jgi:uncharacterized protein (TIGR02145 family)|uniref:FISUMP domain-containing protein n=1 Tax=Flavobacterium sp. TaxID=239 RepID=UPI0037C0DCE2